MKFMMLMIPAIYRGNRKLDPNFATDLHAGRKVAARLHHGRRQCPATHYR